MLDQVHEVDKAKKQEENTKPKPWRVDDFKIQSYMRATDAGCDKCYEKVKFDDFFHLRSEYLKLFYEFYGVEEYRHNPQAHECWKVVLVEQNLRI